MYIHEFIDIIGHNRAKYMHHMTANWSPIAQAERQQLCYGVWGIVGTTRGWPQVLNLWEEQGFQGLADVLPSRVEPPGAAGPQARQVVGEARELPEPGRRPRARAGAVDLDHRRVVCRRREGRVLRARAGVRVEPGHAGSYLEEVAERGQALYEEHGWKLIGAWETAMVNETEAFLLWAVPSWEQWGALEAAERTHGPFRTYRQSTFGQTRDFHRFLLVDSPLSPMRTGRQPHVSDRDPEWQE